MAPTEYRVIAKRATLRRFDALRGLVAAGEALNPEVLRAWHEATGLWIRDGYGQTETGQLTGMPLGEEARPGSMGTRAAGRVARRRRRRARRRPRDGADLLRPLPRRRGRAGRAVADRRPRAPRRRRLPLLRGPARRRDHLRRLPDRSVRGRVRAGRPRRRGGGGGRGGARRGARQRRARGRRPARRRRAVRDARDRAAGPRQGPDRAVQVPARRRLRRRAAQDGERKGPPRAALRTG